LYPRAIEVRAASSGPKEHPVVRETHAWLDAHRDAPGALRRIIMELAADAERAVELQVACLSR
ncbi:hypothetical protein K1Y78_63345, partial [Streptomyces sp. tea 10]|nr:hypothetical protein [Streptomyces sp. tea 10]